MLLNVFSTLFFDYGYLKGNFVNMTNTSMSSPLFPVSTLAKVIGKFLASNNFTGGECSLDIWANYYAPVIIISNNSF